MCSDLGNGHYPRRMPPGRSLTVVVAGVNFAGNRLGAQHIAERLAETRSVLYVNPPVSLVGAARRPWLRASVTPPLLRQLGPTLWQLTPLVPPGKSRAGTRPLVEAVAHWHLRRAVRAIGLDVGTMIQIPPHFRWFGVVGEKHRVHLASDDFVAAAALNAVSGEWVRRREAEIGGEIDAVVAVSEPLVQRWRALGHQPIFMPNGCDYDLFSSTPDVEPAPDVILPRPIAGFIGTLSDRTDARVLASIADRGHSMLLVGPRSATAPNPALDAVLARPNVQWVGPRPHTDVPRYLAHVDVGLVPYTQSDFNRASFPLKALDYLAAGLAVVSTDLPSVRWIDDELIDLADSSDGFLSAVEERLAHPGTSAERERRQALASEHSWDRRVRELVRDARILP